MKTILALTALAGCALAQSQFDSNSAPFRLFIKSDNSSIDGLSIGACHEGAATEGLCMYPKKQDDPVTYSTTFYHATDSSESPIDNPGILFWNLTIGDNQTYPSAMRFSIIETSNVAMPILMPGNSPYTGVSFSEGGCMYIPWSFDDTVVPAQYITPPKKLENWYICVTKYAYTYTALTWKIGLTGEPQNPSCQKVQICQVFI